MNVAQKDLFGDRAPPGYKKVKLLSKSKNQVYWLFESEEEPTPREDGKQKDKDLHIVQQIPRDIENFSDCMTSLKNIQSDLIKRLKRTSGMRNLVFLLKEIIDD